MRSASPHQEDKLPVREMAWFKCHSPIVCLPPTRLFQLSPLAGTSSARLFFSVPQHQNSLVVHRTHTHGSHIDNQQTCMRVGTHAHECNTSCESSLIELAPQLKARVTISRSKMWGLRAKQVLSQSVGRGKCCNSLRLWDHRESSTGFFRSLHPPPGLREIENINLFIFTHCSTNHLTFHPLAFHLCFSHLKSSNILLYFPLFTQRSCKSGGHCNNILTFTEFHTSKTNPVDPYVPRNYSL